MNQNPSGTADTGEPSRTPNDRGPGAAEQSTGIWNGRRALVLAGALMLGLAFLGMQSVGTSVHDVPLRVAISPWPGYEFARLAVAKGFFEQEGVRVQLVQTSSLDDSRRAYERGQVDGMFGTIVELLVARRRAGLESEVALVVDCSDGADVILAKSEITRVVDLRGKRVAVEPASLNLVLLSHALGTEGLSLADVRLVQMPSLEMRRAFESGEVDAAVCYPPTSIEIGKLAGTTRVFSTSQVPGLIADVLLFEQGASLARA
ncbi:MAG: ABC transporter substrate-binding protein, partial [Phycisphaerales bacterium]